MSGLSGVPMTVTNRARTERRVDEVCDLFSSLRREDLGRLIDLYAAGAHFVDPFNDVRGVASIQAIFAHMFDTLDQPRFDICRRIVADRQAALYWRFTFRRGGRWQIDGSSLLVFNDALEIVEHLDYWDSGTQLLMRLPLVGALVRTLYGRLRAPLPPHGG